MGQALSGSRNLYALAEQGDLPRVFGRVHPSFRTPVNAIVVTSAVALALALSGRYADLAPASAISRLLVYRRDVRVDAAAAVPAQFAGRVSAADLRRAARSRHPGGGDRRCRLTILAGARRDQLLAGGACARCRCGAVPDRRPRPVAGRSIAKFRQETVKDA